MKSYLLFHIKTIEMIIDSEGREIKLLMEYLKGTVYNAYRSYYKGVFFFLFRGNVFPDFGSNKSKSGSSIIIAYPWLMKIKVGYKSGVVTLNLRG